MANITGLLHASLLIADVERSRAFYEGVLGLKSNRNRPELGFPGVWYDVGRGGQIHLLCLANPDPVTGRPEHGGRDRHTALAVTDWEGMKTVLDTAGVAYTLSRSGRRALFVRDPDGNALELVETVKA
ncbi:MAG: VOC family protein [Parasulfuritortus sp.]|jgi:glyoxylase I family protein|nr:VOC family protein [Parasulfuritortus sp.]